VTAAAVGHLLSTAVWADEHDDPAYRRQALVALVRAAGRR
jgi:hypothetical protein